MMIHSNSLRILICCTLLLGMVQTVDAQQIQATRSHLSAEDGLVSNAVSGIFQDDLGYLWIATWNGLSRYDGYHFYNYKTGNASRIKNLHNRILDMVIDQSQNVWMRMYDGRVFVLDRKKDQFINPFEDLSGNEDFKTDIPLLVTSWGDVLVSIGLGKLYLMRLDKNGLSCKSVSTGGAIILSMTEGYMDDILLGTDKGVRHLNHRSLTIDKKAILENEEISCLYANGYNIYAGTENGAIYQFANSQKPNLIRHPSVARVQGDIDTVRRLQETVGLRYGQPVNVDTHIVEERTDLQAVLLRSDTHHLMQRSLDLDPVADIARGEAAGQVVLFEDQDILDSSRLQLQRTGESRKTRAHDDDIIVVFVKVHVFHLANKV